MEFGPRTDVRAGGGERAALPPARSENLKDVQVRRARPDAGRRAGPSPETGARRGSPSAAWSGGSSGGALSTAGRGREEEQPPRSYGQTYSTVTAAAARCLLLRTAR